MFRFREIAFKKIKTRYVAIRQSAIFPTESAQHFLADWEYYAKNCQIQRYFSQKVINITHVFLKNCSLGLLRRAMV